MNQDQFYPYPPQEPQEPQYPGTYQTGSTRPPKNSSGLVAFLLVVVIVLLGVVTLLGVMNVKLFRQLGDQLPEETLGISISNQNQLPIATVGQVQPTEAPTDPIEIATTPTAEANYAREGALSLHQIYSDNIAAVVSIICTGRGTSTGTGVVLTADGYIVTNCHVVEGARDIQILFNDDRQLSAKLIGADSISDIAVLQVNATDLPFAQLGDSASLQVGDAVVAIGDPLGTELRGTMTDGIISAINRDVNVGGRVMNLIQTNAALNSGNSGGPLLNCYGQVIGINTMKMGDSMSVAGVEGLGFAIPSNTVGTIVNQLITQGFVSGRPYLGIYGEDVTNFYQFYYGLPYGLYITHVEAGSPAAQVGLRAGDVLVGVNNARISGVEDYENLLYSGEPGDQWTITIYRDYHQYTASVTLGEANN